jgi:ADP-ribosylglycohydrolase
MSNPADHVERVITALRGKEMTPQTEFISRSMHSYISTTIKELAKDDKESPFNLPSFDGALQAVTIVAAIARNEEKQSPADIMELIVKALSETHEVREETIAKLADAAIANITAGVHVMDAPPQEPEA